MPFGSVGKFIRKANQHVFFRKSDELNGFGNLSRIEALTLEINDWEPYETACNSFIQGNRTEFSPVYFSVFEASTHTLLYKIEVTSDGVVLRNLLDKVR